MIVRGRIPKRVLRKEHEEAEWLDDIILEILMRFDRLKQLKK